MLGLIKIAAVVLLLRDLELCEGSPKEFPVSTKENANSSKSAKALEQNAYKYQLKLVKEMQWRNATTAIINAACLANELLFVSIQSSFNLVVLEKTGNTLRHTNLKPAVIQLGGYIRNLYNDLSQTAVKIAALTETTSMGMKTIHSSAKSQKTSARAISISLNMMLKAANESLQLLKSGPESGTNSLSLLDSISEALTKGDTKEPINIIMKLKKEVKNLQNLSGYIDLVKLHRTAIEETRYLITAEDKTADVLSEKIKESVWNTLYKIKGSADAIRFVETAYANLIEKFARPKVSHLLEISLTPKSKISNSRSDIKLECKEMKNKVEKKMSEGILE